MSQVKYAIKCISSSLSILNNSYISDEPYLIDSYLSAVNISENTIANTDANKELIKILTSNLTIDNTIFHNISSSNSSSKLITVSDESYLNLTYVHYSKSSLQLLRAVSSSVIVMKSNIDNIELSDRLILMFN